MTDAIFMGQTNTINHESPGKFQEARFEKIHNLSYSSATESSKLVANEIAHLIKTTVDRKFVLGLATGSSPIDVYKELVWLHQNENLSFKNVVTFNLDEYYPISPKEAQSYHHFMRVHLFDHIDIPKDQINIPKGNLTPDEIRDYCKMYENKIASLGGLDYQLLGIGRTAHIGFNEPGSHRNSVTRLVTLDPLTLNDAAKDFNGVEKVPKKAITMGINTIMNAKRIVLLAWGSHKASVVAKTIEGPISEVAPASFLQEHPNVTFILDKEASSDLTRINTPWLVLDCEWTEVLTKKAVFWLCKRVSKSILKLTPRDYSENGLSGLINTYGSVYDLNIWMFNQVQKTITGWPGGKPKFSDENRPERANPSSKRSLIFSPHPVDDIISMGGTISRLIEQGHQVHIAYQTSGSRGVSNEHALRYIEVYLQIEPDQLNFQQLKNEILNTKEGHIDSVALRELKGFIRVSESLESARLLNLPKENVHFLNLPFYENGITKKNNPNKKDLEIISSLIQKIKPHQIFAAGNLGDPHSTQRLCWEILLSSINELQSEPFMKDCWVWMYKGGLEHWDLQDIDMAVPMSPSQVNHKISLIHKHQSQIDQLLVLEEDNNSILLRTSDLNRSIAKEYNFLGMSEYEAIETFKRFYF